MSDKIPANTAAAFPAAEVCPACHGTGEVAVADVYADGRTAFSDCPDCDGVGLMDMTKPRSPWSGFNDRG